MKILITENRMINLYQSLIENAVNYFRSFKFGLLWISICIVSAKGSK